MIQMNCPVCFNDIQQDRIVDGSVYCPCGHTMFLSRRKAGGVGSTSTFMVVFTALLIGAIVHAINWDTYFFSIIPLKVKQLGGLASVQELKEIAKICNIRKKDNCEIQALEKSFQLSKKEVESLLRVGEIYIKNNNFYGAAKTYSTYFKHSGKDESARYFLARSLGEIGQFKEAKKQFHYILKRDRSNPQFKVARSYVELLIKNSDYSTAKGIIEEYRRAGPSSALFLEKEWKAINDKLRGA